MKLNNNHGLKRQLKLIILLLCILSFVYFTFEVFPKMLSGGTLEIIGGIFIMLVLIVVLGNLIFEKALEQYRSKK